MKNKIFKISLIISIAFVLSCSKDFLDRQPLDQIVTSTFYKTESDAQQALVSIYDVLQYQSVSAWAPLVTTSDMLSDDAFAGGGDANDGFEEDQFNNFNISPINPMVHSIWLRNYIGIYRANLLLEKLPEIGFDDDNLKLRIEAESKFLRAYFYFDLVRYFENVPLLLATIKGPSEFAQPQADVADVYNQIAKDLNEAIINLPKNAPGVEPGRVTKWAAESFLARVYLFYNGVYSADLVAGDVTLGKAQVLAYLEEVISTSGHGLLANYDSIFRKSGEYSIESVFEIGHGDNPVWWDWNYTVGGEGNLASQMQGPRVGGSELFDRGWSFAPVSNKLVNDMAGDPRSNATILTEAELISDPSSSFTLAIGYQHTGNYSRKYSSDAEHWGSGGQFELNRTTNFRVIRFSDVLLMAAELGSANAQMYLDQVRARVGLLSVPVNLDNIYNERRLEFALEGIRYFDVIRRGMAYASQELTVVGDRGPN